jgi:NTP pyrophosphatase (non-canonical NTP hydrolase)
MDFITYQAHAIRTAVDHHSPADRFANAILGIAGEVGEVANDFLNPDEAGDAYDPSLLTMAVDAVASQSWMLEHIKKVWFHGQELAPAPALHAAVDAIAAQTALAYALGLSVGMPETPKSINLKDGMPQDTMALVSELGDILWYLALAAEALGVSLDQIAKHNVAKLQRRYPDGFAYPEQENHPHGE